MLWKTFEAMREEVMGDWQRLHNEELHDLYSSPNIIQVIRSITIRWEKHVIYIYIYTIFARVICALFFSILAAEKLGSIKYADFLWRS